MSLGGAGFQTGLTERRARQRGLEEALRTFWWLARKKEDFSLNT
jgi:hypothetical protein